MIDLDGIIDEFCRRYRVTRAQADEWLVEQACRMRLPTPSLSEIVHRFREQYTAEQRTAPMSAESVGAANEFIALACTHPRKAWMGGTNQPTFCGNCGVRIK